MTNNVKSIITLLFVLVFITSSVAQQKVKSLSDGKTKTPMVSFFVAGDYFTPKFANVDNVYQTIEKNFSLPNGTAFKTPYVALFGVRFYPDPTNAIQGEFGGSVLSSPQESSTNFLQMYYAGGSYILCFPIPMVSVYGGGGGGYIWLNTQRTYKELPGVAHVNAQLAQLHGVLGLEFFDPSGISFAIEGRYTYATTVSPRRSDLDVTLKGFTGGIRIGVPLLMFN